MALDDKGLVIILNLGLPLCSHADDAGRGVQLALQVRSLLRQRCRIGMSKGPAFCGFVGSASRFEYTVMGSCVNLAARLMGKCALGEVLVDEFCYRHARASATFCQRPSVHAKGYVKLYNRHMCRR